MNFKTQIEIYLDDEQGNKYARVVIQQDDNIYNICHTFVLEDHRGEGLATLLMERAVEYIQSLGGIFKADCSYAAHYLEKHGIDFIE